MKKTLSVIVIAKNEEERIGRILSDAKRFANEIIVVDTGSTDNTREIAGKAGARVYNMVWQDDFSLARNTALSYATCDFILWLDADDRVSAKDAERIIDTVKRAGEKDAFTAEVINSSKDNRPSSFMQLRLFPKSDKIKFEGKIHESVAGTAKAAGFNITASDIQIIHTGYETAKARDEKMRRNFLILEKELEREPKNITLRFLFANTLSLSGRPNDALAQYEYIATMPGAEKAQADVYIRALIALSRAESDAAHFAGAETWAQKAAQSRPDDMEARFCLSRALYGRGSLSGAMREVEAALALKPYISSVNVDFISIRAAIYDLGVKILHQSQKHLDAVSMIQNGLLELPYSIEMVHLAASYYILLGRYDEAETVYRRAILRIPESTDELNGKLRGLKMLKEKGGDETHLHPEYLKQVPSGTSSALAIGIGSGILGLELKKAGVSRVVGLLLEGDNRDIASVRFDAVQSDLELQASGERFDVVLFGDRLNTLKYPDHILSIARKALKPEGKAIFVFPNFQNYTVLTSLGYGFFNYGDTGIVRDGYRRLFTRSSALEYLEAHGFKGESIHEIVDPLFTQQIQHAPQKAVSLGKAILDLEGLSEDAMRDFFVIQYFITAASRPDAKEIASSLHVPQNIGKELNSSLNAKGVQLINEGKFIEAASIFHQVIKKDKNDFEAFSNLGLTEWYQGHFEDAYFLFKKSIELCPDYEDGYMNLWDAAKKIGREQETLSILRAASVKNPTFLEVRGVIESA